MQFREIEDSNLSLWLFFVVAAVLTTLVYGFRLLTRSRRTLSLKDELGRRIRSREGIDRNRPVSTTAFVVWLLVELRNPIFWLLWLSMTCLPLTFLWMSHLSIVSRGVITGVVVAIALCFLPFRGFRVPYDSLSLVASFITLAAVLMASVAAQSHAIGARRRTRSSTRSTD